METLATKGPTISVTNFLLGYTTAENHDRLPNYSQYCQARDSRRNLDDFAGIGGKVLRAS
jgi:hypothetical protein